MWNRSREGVGVGRGRRLLVVVGLMASVIALTGPAGESVVDAGCTVGRQLANGERE